MESGALRGEKAAVMLNIEQRTPNIEHRKAQASFVIDVLTTPRALRHWMLDVRRWLLEVWARRVHFPFAFHSTNPTFAPSLSARSSIG
jgi:hypothetical protein